MEENGSGQGIRIAVILGSVRPGNYTAMAAALAVDELRKHPRTAAEVLDPVKLALPLPGTAPEHAGASVLREKVSSVLSGKPVALLGVAAGSIGAIKSLEHLRGVVSHVGGLALPMPVSVANVQRVFDRQGRCLDPAVEKVVRGLAVTLLHYLESSVCPRVTLERLVREGLAPAAEAL